MRRLIKKSRFTWDGELTGSEVKNGETEKSKSYREGKFAIRTSVCDANGRTCKNSPKKVERNASRRLRKGTGVESFISSPKGKTFIRRRTVSGGVDT